MAPETPFLSRRILVADDDPENLSLIRSIIEAEGYTMVPASDGREAYRILSRDSDFLVCVFDGVMPYLGGQDLISFMQTEKRFMRIPKIIMTGEENPALPARSFTAGAAAYLPKPIAPLHLRTILHMLINRDAAQKGPATLSVR